MVEYNSLNGSVISKETTHLMGSYDIPKGDPRYKHWLVSRDLSSCIKPYLCESIFFPFLDSKEIKYEDHLGWVCKHLLWLLFFPFFGSRREDVLSIGIGFVCIPI